MPTLAAVNYGSNMGAVVARLTAHRLGWDTHGKGCGALQTPAPLK